MKVRKDNYVLFLDPFHFHLLDDVHDQARLDLIGLGVDILSRVVSDQTKGCVQVAWLEISI